MPSIYDAHGGRKYLTIAERKAFLRAVSRFSPRHRLFCEMLAHTGGRLSEILALTPDKIDIDSGVVIIESLKKRRRGVFRAIPIPPALLLELDRVFDIETKRTRPETNQIPLWWFGRTTAWKIVKQAMENADISGTAASPKGLRHSFGVSAIQAGVPITLVKKWLGHSRLEATAIYADVVGDEERQIASLAWRTFK